MILRDSLIYNINSISISFACVNIKFIEALLAAVIQTIIKDAPTIFALDISIAVVSVEKPNTVAV